MGGEQREEERLTLSTMIGAESPEVLLTDWIKAPLPCSSVAATVICW